MRHIDLFSGIGGFALAAKTVWGEDYETVLFCDNDRFCQEILRKRFPGVPVWGDIRELIAYATGERREDGSDSGKKGQILHDTDGVSPQDKPERQGRKRGFEPFNSVGLLTGGFPCQPFSVAGRKHGTADNRYLWPEMFRVIQITKPAWIIAENVGGLISWNDGMVLQKVCTDMESEGYEVQPFIIPAVSVNAPHRRDRLWFVAHRQSLGDGGRTGQERPIQERTLEQDKRQRSEIRSESEGRVGSHTPDSSDNGMEGRGESGKQKPDKHGKETLPVGDSQGWDTNWIDVATRFCRVDDGLPARVDGFELSKSRHRVERLKTLGNAIVPQVAVQIMKAIKEVI